MTVKNVRVWAWAGALTSALLVALIIGLITLDLGHALFAASFFVVSGYLLQARAQNYTRKQLRQLTWKRPFLQGITGPIYIITHDIMEMVQLPFPDL